jgi:hypothetical protein
VATDEEVRLGRLIVRLGHATEEQVLDALRERNRSPKGPDLASILETRGVVSPAVVAKLRKETASGGGAVLFTRAEASTEHEISIQSTREVLARDQLDEALRLAKTEPKLGHRDLKRLAEEFRDTESGVRAANEARELEEDHPEFRGPT